MIKSTTTKLILSGSFIESYSYLTKPLIYGSTNPIRNRGTRNVDPEDASNSVRKLESKKRSLRRTRKALQDLIGANAWQWMNESDMPYAPIFATFTFKDDIRDVKSANRIFTRFICSLNYAVYGSMQKSHLRYVSVLEFQDMNREGVIHYHVVYFNFPIEQEHIISKIWKYGFVDIKEIKEINDISNIKIYVSKKISPNYAEDTRLDGCKRYFASRGLLKPIVTHEEHQAAEIISQIPKSYIASEDEYDGFQGKVRIVRYMLEKGKSLSDIVHISV